MGGYLDENENLMDRHELNRRVSSIQKENKQLREKIVYLQRKIDVLLETVEFYACIESWQHLNTGSIKYGKIIPSDYGIGNFDQDQGYSTDDNYVGGLRARQALKEIKEI